MKIFNFYKFASTFLQVWIFIV